MRDIVKIIKMVANMVAITLVSYCFVTANEPLTMDVRPNDPAEVVEPSKAERLVETHKCWTDAAPEGVIPGHVVITIDDRTYIAGSDMTGQAIEQAVFGTDHGIDTIHGFCR